MPMLVREVRMELYRGSGGKGGGGGFATLMMLVDPKTLKELMMMILDQGLNYLMIWTFEYEQN